jgi:hypothetical protein
MRSVSQARQGANQNMSTAPQINFQSYDHEVEIEPYLSPAQVHVYLHCEHHLA